jgi:hypothetical protein
LIDVVVAAALFVLIGLIAGDLHTEHGSLRVSLTTAPTLIFVVLVALYYFAYRRRGLATFVRPGRRGAWRDPHGAGRQSQQAGRSGPGSLSAASAGASPAPVGDARLLDLNHHREQVNARVAELQWDLGGLAYEMAIRNRIRVDVLVRRAAELQTANAELEEVERMLRLEQTSTAGQCGSCGAPHSSGAAYCWQCGQPLLQQLHSDGITAPD